MKPASQAVVLLFAALFLATSAYGSQIVRKTLQEKTRLSDLVVIAKVHAVKDKEVKDQAHQFEKWQADCSVAEALKGKLKEKAISVYFLVKPREDRRKLPEGEKLEPNKTYILFLRQEGGSLVVISPWEGSMVRAEEYEVWDEDHKNDREALRRSQSSINNVPLMRISHDELVSKIKTTVQKEKKEHNNPIVPAAKSYKVDGATLEVALVPDKQEIMLGEPVYLFLRVHNRSDIDLQTIQGGDYRNRLGRPERYSITAVDKNGETVPLLDAGPSMGGQAGPQKIPAKGMWTRRLFLPHWVRLMTAGDYTITCKTVLRMSRPTPARWDPDERASNVEVEVETQLRVTPQDRHKMGKLIQELGEAMFRDNSDVSEAATRSLTHIEDERVIPFFVKAVQTRRYGLKFAGLEALAKFSSDEALQGVKKGMTAAAADFEGATTAAAAAQLANNIRHAAAGALARSPHPDAVKLLLSMNHDPYNGVRVEVLHALGRMNSRESLEILRQMSRDPDKLVRDEALRHLKLRTGKPSE